MAIVQDKRTAQQVVDREFAKVNKHYFNGQIVADIALEVPPINVAVSITNPSQRIEPGSSAETGISEAIGCSLQGDHDTAVRKLVPYAKERYREAIEALISIERNRHGDYLRWARMLNNLDKVVKQFPAACIDRDIGKLFIHPMIGQPSCPRYVMKYLIHHECLHLLIPPTPESNHPPEFMEQERAFPKRDKARAWLRQKKFPLVAE